MAESQGMKKIKYKQLDLGGHITIDDLSFTPGSKTVAEKLYLMKDTKYKFTTKYDIIPNTMMFYCNGIAIDPLGVICLDSYTIQIASPDIPLDSTDSFYATCSTNGNIQAP